MDGSAPPHTRAAPRLAVELIDDLGRLRTLGAAWEALNTEAVDHDAPFFQSHAWCMHVARVRLQRSASHYRLCTAAIFEGPHLVGVWPLARQRVAGTWVVRGLDEPFGQFAGIACRSVEDVPRCTASALGALRRSRLAAGIALSNVIAGTPLHRALVGNGARSRPSNEAVSVDMRESPTFEHFAQSVNKKTRKNLRNLLSRLRREAGDPLHTIEEEPARLESLLRRTFDSRMEWMQEHARTSPAFRDPDFRAVMEALDTAPGVALLGFLIACNGEDAASQWGFRYLDRYYAYMSGKSSRFEPFSVGRVHLAMVVEACKARGVSVLELMAPASDYKLTWATHRKPLASLALPFSLRGRVLLDLFLGTLVPAAHATSRLLPRAVRDPLVNTLFNR